MVLSNALILRSYNVLSVCLAAQGAPILTDPRCPADRCSVHSRSVEADHDRYQRRALSRRKFAITAPSHRRIRTILLERIRRFGRTKPKTAVGRRCLDVTIGRRGLKRIPIIWKHSLHA